MTAQKDGQQRTEHNTVGAFAFAATVVSPQLKPDSQDSHLPYSRNRHNFALSPQAIMSSGVTSGKWPYYEDFYQSLVKYVEQDHDKVDKFSEGSII